MAARGSNNLMPGVASAKIPALTETQFHLFAEYGFIRPQIITERRAKRKNTVENDTSIYYLGDGWSGRISAVSDMHLM